MSSMRAVAIRSVGVVCGYGDGLSSLATGLMSGQSAAAPIRGWSGAALSVRSAVQVPGDCPDIEGFADDRKVALLARALAQVGAAPSDVPSERRGVFLGTGLSSVTPVELGEDIYPYLVDGSIDRAAAAMNVRPSAVAPWRHLPALATSWLARQWGATGAGSTSF
ncbi:MAG: 3-oxoacyl-(acyl-carrier-protein) synthase, partial [Kiritimatiellia bacterium]